MAILTKQGDRVEDRLAISSEQGSPGATTVEREVHDLLEGAEPVHYRTLLERTGERIGRDTLNRILLDGMEAGDIVRVDDFRYALEDR